MTMRYVSRPIQQEESTTFRLPRNAVCFELEKVIEERCDDLDYYLEDQGYEILHREYKRVATSIYDYQVYVIKID